MPEENEVYLAVPYLNEDGLELYTRLILRKLVSLVISSSTNIQNYEQEYTANPAVEIRTIEHTIEPDTIYNLPLSYGVGSKHLHVTVSGYMMYPGIDYEEIGEEGETSYQIKFLTSIEAGSILGVVVYPRQFSFGRNINVSSLVAPSLALSEHSDSILSVDEEGKAILTSTTIEEIVGRQMEGVLHVEGIEDIAGQKTFKTPIQINLSENEPEDGKPNPVTSLTYVDVNGAQSSMDVINIIGRENDSCSGTILVGSTKGCTFIGSGDAFLELPSAFDRTEVEFANEQSVVVAAKSKIAFYTGCGNEENGFTKVADFDEYGTARFYGTIYASTQVNGDSSNAVATTEFVSNALNNFQSTMSETIDFDIASISFEQINTLFD